MKKESWISRMFTPRETSAEEIVSPLAGEVIPLESVSDPTFAGKILGDGLAVIPSDGRLYAPADGTIENLMETKHALGLVTKGLRAELLIHVGRDTVSLNGQHFTLHVQEGEKVRRGQLLLEFDRDALLALGFDLATPVLVCNGDEFELQKSGCGQVQPGAPLLTLTRRQSTNG